MEPLVPEFDEIPSSENGYGSLSKAFLNPPMPTSSSSPSSRQFGIFVLHNTTSFPILFSISGQTIMYIYKQPVEYNPTDQKSNSKHDKHLRLLIKPNDIAAGIFPLIFPTLNQPSTALLTVQILHSDTLCSWKIFSLPHEGSKDLLLRVSIPGKESSNSPLLSSPSSSASLIAPAAPASNKPKSASEKRLASPISAPSRLFSFIFGQDKDKETRHSSASSYSSSSSSSSPNITSAFIPFTLEPVTYRLFPDWRPSQDAPVFWLQNNITTSLPELDSNITCFPSLSDPKKSSASSFFRSSSLSSVSLLSARRPAPAGNGCRRRPSISLFDTETIPRLLSSIRAHADCVAALDDSIKLLIIHRPAISSSSSPTSNNNKLPVCTPLSVEMWLEGVLNLASAVAVTKGRQSARKRQLKNGSEEVEQTYRSLLLVSPSDEKSVKVKAENEKKEENTFAAILQSPDLGNDETEQKEVERRLELELEEHTHGGTHQKAESDADEEIEDIDTFWSSSAQQRSVLDQLKRVQSSSLDLSEIDQIQQQQQQQQGLPPSPSLMKPSASSASLPYCSVPSSPSSSPPAATASPSPHRSLHISPAASPIHAPVLHSSSSPSLPVSLPSAGSSTSLFPVEKITFEHISSDALSSPTSISFHSYSAALESESEEEKRTFDGTVVVTRICLKGSRSASPSSPPSSPSSDSASSSSSSSSSAFSSTSYFSESFLKSIASIESLPVLILLLMDTSSLPSSNDEDGCGAESESILEKMRRREKIEAEIYAAFDHSSVYISYVHISYPHPSSSSPYMPSSLSSSPTPFFQATSSSFSASASSSSSSSPRQASFSPAFPASPSVSHLASSFSSLRRPSLSPMSMSASSLSNPLPHQMQYIPSSSEPSFVPQLESNELGSTNVIKFVRRAVETAATRVFNSREPNAVLKAIKESLASPDDKSKASSADAKSNSSAKKQSRRVLFFSLDNEQESLEAAYRSVISSSVPESSSVLPPLPYECFACLRTREQFLSINTSTSKMPSVSRSSLTRFSIASSSRSSSASFSSTASYSDNAIYFNRPSKRIATVSQQAVVMADEAENSNCSSSVYIRVELTVADNEAIQVLLHCEEDQAPLALVMTTPKTPRHQSFIDNSSSPVGFFSPVESPSSLPGSIANGTRLALEDIAELNLMDEKTPLRQRRTGQQGQDLFMSAMSFSAASPFTAPSPSPVSPVKAPEEAPIIIPPPLPFLDDAVISKDDIIVLSVELSGSRLLLAGEGGLFEKFFRCAKARSKRIVLFIDRLDDPSSRLSAFCLPNSSISASLNDPQQPRLVSINGALVYGNEWDLELHTALVSTQKLSRFINFYRYHNNNVGQPWPSSPSMTPTEQIDFREFWAKATNSE